MTIEYIGNNIKTLTTFSNYKLFFTYKDGKVIEIKDELGRTVHYKYEGDYLTEVVHVDRGKTRYEYDENGCLTCITDQNGNSYDRNYYDKKCRVIRQDFIDEECVVTYDDSEKEITFHYTNSNRTEKTRYNNDKLVTHKFYSDGTTEEYGYDSHQKRIYEKDRNGNETFRVYNEYGSLLKETKPDGLITEYSYDENQNVIKETDNL